MMHFLIFLFDSLNVARAVFVTIGLEPPIETWWVYEWESNLKTLAINSPPPFCNLLVTKITARDVRSL